jgi:hypothetical protein
MSIGCTHAGLTLHLAKRVRSRPRTRIIAAATGELLRELTLGPARNCQPTGAPKRRPTNRTQ